MRLYCWMLASALYVSAGLGQSTAQTQIAVIHFQNALLSTADMQKQSAELEAKYRGRQEEIERLSTELQEIQSKLQSATGDEAARLQSEGQRKQRSAQRLSEDLQSDVEFDRQNILSAAATKMREIVRDLRIEKELDLIVDQTSVLAHSALIDLTAEATQAYDEKYPVN